MATSVLSPALQTMFADLVQQVQTAPPAGSVYEREGEGTVYLYAKVSVGSVRVDTFLGRKEDSAAQMRATAMRQGMALAKERRATVSMLKRRGLAGPIRILGETLDAFSQAGLFGAGAVLVGTGAYMLYEPLVGHRLPAPTLMTSDIDLAIAHLALSADPPASMTAILHRADRSFTGIPQLDPRAPSSRFRNADGYLVDLIAPVRTRDDANPMRIPALAAGAAPLQYLAWLIADSVPTIALWGAGVPVVVPQPARFAVHKLILAQRRDPANRIKRQKDLAQASALLDVLQVQDRYALEDAFESARSNGDAGWKQLIDRSLTEIR